MAVPTIVRERTPQLIVLAVILALNAIISPGFFSIEIQNDRLYGSLIDVLNRGAPVTLLAIGMTLVIATKGIDLSVGAVMAIVGAVAASLITSGYSLPATLAGSLFVGLACGIWNGILVAFLGLQPIVATLVLMVAGRGIAQLISGGKIITFNDPAFDALVSGSFLTIPAPVIVVLVVGVLLFGLLQTAVVFSGREVLHHAAARAARARAVGFNEWMAFKAMRVASIPTSGKMLEPVFAPLQTTAPLAVKALTPEKTTVMGTRADRKGQLYDVAFALTEPLKLTVALDGLAPLQAGRGRPTTAERPTPPDRTDLLPPSITRYTTRFVYSAEHSHLSFEQGGGHHGSHPHLVHEFVRSIVEGRKPAIDAVTAANWTAPGICAHESAMRGGAEVEVPSFE